MSGDNLRLDFSCSRSTGGAGAPTLTTPTLTPTTLRNIEQMFLDHDSSSILDCPPSPPEIHENAAHFVPPYVALSRPDEIEIKEESREDYNENDKIQKWNNTTKETDPAPMYLPISNHIFRSTATTATTTTTISPPLRQMLSAHDIQPPLLQLLPSVVPRDIVPPEIPGPPVNTSEIFLRHLLPEVALRLHMDFPQSVSEPISSRISKLSPSGNVPVSESSGASNGSFSGKAVISNDNFTGHPVLSNDSFTSEPILSSDSYTRQAVLTNGTSTSQGSSSRIFHNDDDKRRELRRQRNKEAAARCRKRRLDQTMTLQEEVDQWEDRNQDAKREIEELEKEKRHLLTVLEAHRAKVNIFINVFLQNLVIFFNYLNAPHRTIINFKSIKL